MKEYQADITMTEKVAKYGTYALLYPKNRDGIIISITNIPLNECSGCQDQESCDYIVQNGGIVPCDILNPTFQPEKIDFRFKNISV